MTETNWQTQPQPELEATILEFKAEFPGWYYSVCECQVSCDATIAPTTDSEDINLISRDCRFDEGFRVDLPQPSSLAKALRWVMNDARAAKEIHGD